MPLDPPFPTEFLPEIYWILAEVYWILKVLNRPKPTADFNRPYVSHDVLYGKQEAWGKVVREGFVRVLQRIVQYVMIECIHYGVHGDALSYINFVYRPSRSNKARQT